MRPEIPDLSSPRRDPLPWPVYLISTNGRHFAGVGAFDSHVKIFNAHFEKRAPWPGACVPGRLDMALFSRPHLLLGWPAPLAACLLEKTVIDTITLLQDRPRLGPLHKGGEI